MTTPEIFAGVQNILTILLKSKGAFAGKIEGDTLLHQGGLGLDSMETATFAAMLSEEFGDDPYLSDNPPQTVSEVVEYYARNQVSQ